MLELLEHPFSQSLYLRPQEAVATQEDPIRLRERRRTPRDRNIRYPGRVRTSCHQQRAYLDLTMEHTLRSPPTIRRRSSHSAFRKNDSSSSSLSNLSYPQIPSRRSSLSLCAGYDSNSSALATSTRTPSLDDSLCNIQVVKIRQANAAKSRDTQKSKCLDASEDPFLDCV